MRRRSSLLALVVASLLATASAQPNKGGGGMGDKKPKPGAPSGPGKDRPPASGKTPAAGKLAFDAATGRLKGTWAGATIPSYRTPMAAPLLGTVGYATDTTLIYGPFEAGFGSGATATSSSDARPPYPCKDGSTYSGYCPGGMDVQTCETTLFKTCASGTVRKELFMDECGGHANPYHIHMDPVCLYKPGADGHSAVVGVMLDGAPLYGRHETTGTPRRTSTRAAGTPARWVHTTSGASRTAPGCTTTTRRPSHRSCSGATAPWTRVCSVNGCTSPGRASAVTRHLSR